MYAAWLMENTRNKLSGRLKHISENDVNIFHFKKARLFKAENHPSLLSPAREFRCHYQNPSQILLIIKSVSTTK